MEGTPPIEPRRDAGEVDGAEEVGGGFVLARSDGPVLPQLGNEVLDQVARLVEALGPPRARGPDRAVHGGGVDRPAVAGGAEGADVEGGTRAGLGAGTRRRCGALCPRAGDRGGRRAGAPARGEPPWCTDRRDGRTAPIPVRAHAMRTGTAITAEAYVCVYHQKCWPLGGITS